MEFSKKLAGAIILLVFLSGCMSVKKAERVMRDNPSELAKLCVDCFPIKPVSVKEGEIIYLPSDTVIVNSKDTVTVIAECPDGTKIKKKCPPCKDRVITVNTLRVDTVTVVDSALERVVSDLRVSVGIGVGRVKMWRNLFLITLAIGIGYVIIRR